MVLEFQERIIGYDYDSMSDIIKQTRIIKDENNFYRCQVRFLPLASYEDSEGWRSYYVSNSLKSAKEVSI